MSVNYLNEIQPTSFSWVVEYLYLRDISYCQRGCASVLAVSILVSLFMYGRFSNP
jgi:hypothetical protein